MGLMPFLRRLGGLIKLGAPPLLNLRVLRWMWRFSIREFAFQWAAVLAVSAVAMLLAGEPDGPVSTAVFALLMLGLITELVFAWQSWRSVAVIDKALDGLPAEPARLRFPRSHLAFPGLMLFSRRVKIERAVVFHREAKRRVRLDVYRPVDLDPYEGPRPAVIQIHGGGWIFGSRLEQGIPLLNHLAANGWVGFNVDYWLSPRATMPAHVIDVKRAIAWVRANAERYGVDPERIVITGGSAGGHLCALAALTANDPKLQPGFEAADTSVAAAVPFYGVYDFTDPNGIYYRGFSDWLMARVVFKRRLEDDRERYQQSSPIFRVNREAPPFLVIHGDHDTLVPVDDARAFAAALAKTSANPVRYIELPDAEHAFDIFPSLRTARIVEAIERFLRAVVRPPSPAQESDDPRRQPEALVSR